MELQIVPFTVLFLRLCSDKLKKYKEGIRAKGDEGWMCDMLPFTRKSLSVSC